MKINILEFVKGAEEAQGLTVIIDVFRAFSVSCYAFDAGATNVIVTDTPDEAFRLKRKYSGALLAGERNEKKIEGFDMGNSPTEILLADLKNKTLIQTTTAGTKGLISARSAETLLAGSLVNAFATACFIKSLNPDSVTLVAMGYGGKISAEEDLLCAELIADRLKGGNKNFTDSISRLKETSGRRFFNPENIAFSPPTDFFLCTMAGRFNFALRAIRRYDGNIEIIKTEI